MRTTINLPDELYRQVKERAQVEGRTVTSFLEEALRQALERHEKPLAKPYRVDAFYGAGGVRSGVDIDDTKALLELLDEGTPAGKRR